MRQLKTAVYLVTVTFLIAGAGTVAYSDEMVQNPSSTASPPLTASVEFSEKIQSLDPVLWPGNVFDKEVATALLKSEASTTSIWRKIPTWQAGDWEEQQATNTQSVKYQNGQPVTDTTSGVYTAKAKFNLGHEKDKESNIWQPYDSGYWANTDYGVFVGYAYIKSHMLGNSDYPDECGESVDFYVDKLTHKIISVQQRKTWVRYVPIADGLMKDESVHTVYDEHGEPTTTAWNTSLCRRKMTFSEYGPDAANYSNFVAYLKNNGLENLIPEAPSASTMSNAVQDKQLSSYASRAGTYFDQHQYQNTIYECDHVIKLNPNIASVYVFRAASYSLLGKYQKAIEDLSTAIQLDPKDTSTYRSRGEAFEMMNQHQKAIEDFNTTIRLDPKDDSAYGMRGSCYFMQNQYPKAIRDFDTAVSLNPKFAVVYHMRGRAYSAMEQYQKAIGDFDTAISLDPKFAAAYYFRGLVYRRLSQQQKARADLARAVQLDPANTTYKSASSE